MLGKMINYDWLADLFRYDISPELTRDSRSKREKERRLITIIRKFFRFCILSAAQV